MCVLKNRSRLWTTQIVTGSLEVLSVRPRPQRQRRLLLSSVLLIDQFHLSLMWIKFQPAGSFPLSNLCLAWTLSRVAWRGKEIWVGVYEQVGQCAWSTGWRRYQVVLWSFGTEPCQWVGGWLPRTAVSTVRQLETGRFRCSRWNSRMDQTSLTVLVPAVCSDTVVEGVCLPCCVTDCLTAPPLPSRLTGHWVPRWSTETLRVSLNMQKRPGDDGGESCWRSYFQPREYVVMGMLTSLVVSTALRVAAFQPGRLFKMISISCSRNWIVCPRLLNTGALQDKKYWPSSERRMMQLLDEESPEHCYVLHQHEEVFLVSWFHWFPLLVALRGPYKIMAC